MPMSPRLRRVAALALAASVLAATAGCSDEGSDDAVGALPGGEVAAAGIDEEGDAAPSPPAPDVLPDPGVAPGRCETRTYTPPTASAPHDGLLCRPAEAQRDVAVVLVHGGGGVEGAPGSLTGWARRLNVEGYVTFQISYHLFSEHGEDEAVFPLPEQNVKAAVQYLRGTGNALGIDKDRIAVQGHSAGARLGAVAFTSPGDRYFAGPELWPAIPDDVNAFIGFYHPYDGTMMFSTTYFGGSEESDDPVVQLRWAQADSLADAEDADAPALFVNGERDWDVIDDQQDEFAARLRADGQVARAVIIERGAHGFDLGGSRLTRLGEEAATHVLEFLNEVFPQDPPRPAQSAEVDLSKAPTGTGSPPTTVKARPRRSGSSSGAGGRTSPTTTVWRSTTSVADDGDASTTIEGGGDSTTTAVPTTDVTPTTVVVEPPTTVAPPTTVVEPPTTVAPPTTAPPPTTVAGG